MACQTDCYDGGIQVRALRAGLGSHEIQAHRSLHPVANCRCPFSHAASLPDVQSLACSVSLERLI